MKVRRFFAPTYFMGQGLPAYTETDSNACEWLLADTDL
jgi:hypothetical protein